MAEREISDSYYLNWIMPAKGSNCFYDEGSKCI